MRVRAAPTTTGTTGGASTTGIVGTTTGSTTSGCPSGFYGDDCTCRSPNPLPSLPLNNTTCTNGQWIVHNVSAISNNTVIVISPNSTVVFAGNLTVGANVTIVFEGTGGLIQISDCLYMNGTTILLKLASDRFAPVNGSTLTLLNYQNCSQVTVGNVTVEYDDECQEVTTQPQQTETRYGVLLQFRKKDSCGNSDKDDDNDTVTKAVVASVCVAAVLVGVGVGGVWYWQKKRKAQEQQDIEVEMGGNKR